MSDINTILNACELVWRQQSIGSTAIAEMRTELSSHLVDATEAGKSPESVVGSDIDGFARSWAGALNRSGRPGRVIPASLAAVRSEREAEAERTTVRLYISLAAIAAVTLMAFIIGPRGTYEGVETWQWVFTLSTFTLLIGELLTGGFFVLPFGIGAAAAAALSFADVEPPTLLVTFIVVSVLGLWGLREFAAKDDDEMAAVGATRYVDQTAIVTEPIHGLGAVGRVRFETESWMAITDGNQYIPEGSVVRISEVRGARLVVSGV